MGIKYANSPIVEATCEFWFSDDTVWDPKTTDILYDMVKELYPKKSTKPRRIIRVVEEALEEEIHSTLLFKFYSKDRKSEISIGNRFLGIRVLKPYPSWDNFRRIIDFVFNKLIRIVNAKGLKRISLSYVNKITLNDEDISQYFYYRPCFSKYSPNRVSDFILSTEIPFIEDNGVSRVLLTTGAGKTPVREEYLFRINYYCLEPGKISITETMNWIDIAHKNIDILFEDSITDKLRDIFNKVE